MSEGLAERDDPATGQIRTFLIADVRGYTRFTVEHGDEAAARLSTQLAEIAAAAAAAHGGRVIEVRGDEVLAVFSSARQALRSAADLQARLVHESIPLGVGVGLDAGEAIPVGDGYRGAALNLAARLCSLAGPGEILVSDTVANLARKVEGLRYVERGAVQLKGFADPVTVMEIHPATTVEGDAARASSELAESLSAPQSLPIGGALGALPSGPLVSRQGELDQVLNVVAGVAEGAGRMVVLAGEPGAGKTRLAQEATVHLHNRGFTIAAGSCYESREAIPYYPFLDALAGLYRAAPASFRALVPSRWPYLGRVLPEVSVSVPTSGLSDQEEQDRLFRAASSFVLAVAETQPVALLLDDLHWADASSLQLLQHLARHTRGQRVFLLGTYRDVEVGPQHPLERALRDLHRDGLIDRVAVRRLGQEGTADLLAAALGVDAISEELAGLVHRHTEGNPFFTQEVLRGLVERGDVYQQDGRWERRQITEIEVPESIRSVIGERFSRLTQETREVLDQASVLGQSFGFEELLAAGDRAERDLESALDEALAAGLVRETGRDEYMFNHALTQQALYAELSGRRRRRLHLAAGRAIEGLSERIRERRLAELAWHFLEGDDLKQALDFALLAGDKAEDVFAHAEAERQYRTALELAQDLEDEQREADAGLKLGMLLERTGRYDDVLAILERALALHQSAGRSDAEALVLAAIGEVHAARRTPEEGVQQLEQFLAGAEPDLIRVSGAPIFSALSRLGFISGNYVEAAEAGQRAADLTRDSGGALFITAERRRLAALSKIGHFRDQLEAYEDLRRVTEAAGDLDNLCSTLNSLGDLYLGEDRVRCTECRTQAVEVAERLGQPDTIAFMTMKLGWNAFQAGDWAEARLLLDRSLAASRSAGSDFHPAQFIVAHLLAATGEWERASEVVEETMALARKDGDLQALRHMAWAAAEKDLMMGRPDRVVEVMEPLLDRPGLEETDVSLILPHFAHAYLEVGDPARADSVSREAVERAGLVGDPDAESAALRVRGMVLAAVGRTDEAAAAFAEGMALARSTAYPYVEARILYEQGRMTARTGDAEAARSHFTEALAVFNRLGARPYIEQTERALADLG